MGSSWQQFSNATPPERGSFPLDFTGICNQNVKEYLKCLKVNKSRAITCRTLLKEYLDCRMKNNLMDKEDFISLGLEAESKPDNPPTTTPSSK